MKKLLAALTLFATVALGGERYLGTIVVTDAGTITNKTMNCYGTLGGCPTKADNFIIPPNAKITIQVDEACFVLTDRAGVDAGTGIALTAGQIFPTSVGPAKTLTGYSYNGDAGAAQATTATGAWVAVSAPIGANTCHARVYERTGTE